MTSAIDLFIFGLVIAAAWEVEFELWIPLCDSRVADQWEVMATDLGWLIQQIGWGDYNRVSP